MTWTEILEVGEYEYYGVRWVHGERLGLGGTPANSVAWEDGVPTDEILNGACAIQVRSSSDLSRILADNSGYLGSPVLLGSYYMEYGVDPGEIIMQKAVVLAL